MNNQRYATMEENYKRQKNKEMQAKIKFRFKNDKEIGRAKRWFFEI